MISLYIFVLKNFRNNQLSGMISLYIFVLKKNKVGTERFFGFIPVANQNGFLAFFHPGCEPELILV
jgi:hypothetical protein